MTRTIAATFATAAVALTFLLVPSPASATKIVPGAELVDVCRNVKGFQSVYEVTGHHPALVLNFATPRRPRDCVRNKLRAARPTNK